MNLRKRIIHFLRVLYRCSLQNPTKDSFRITITSRSSHRRLVCLVDGLALQGLHRLAEQPTGIRSTNGETHILQESVSPEVGIEMLPPLVGIFNLFIGTVVRKVLVTPFPEILMSLRDRIVDEGLQRRKAIAIDCINTNIDKATNQTGYIVKKCTCRIGNEFECAIRKLTNSSLRISPGIDRVLYPLVKWRAIIKL